MRRGLYLALGCLLLSVLWMSTPSVQQQSDGLTLDKPIDLRLQNVTLMLVLAVEKNIPIGIEYGANEKLNRG